MIATAKGEALVVLMGPPNTGKSTLFNQLTGLRQRVANYPGVTVEMSEGRAWIDGAWTRILDLPGTQSLNVGAPDEQMGLALLAGGCGMIGDRPDVIVHIVEAARPGRGLLVAWQAAAFGIPQVVVMNFADEAARLGIHLDASRLESAIGCPVVLTTGPRGHGIEELKNAISRSMKSQSLTSPLPYPAVVNEAAQSLARRVEEVTGRPLALSLARRCLLDARSAPGDTDWPEAERRPYLAALREEVQRAGTHPFVIESRLAEARLKALRSEGVLSPSLPAHAHPVDRWLLHPVSGPVIFILCMALLFQAVYAWSEPVMDGIESLFGLLASHVGAWLEPMPLLQGLVTDGLIGGVGGVIVFLPQIMILYALVTLLEDVGYLSRAAFLSDRIFSWCGLSGRSFIPLLSSFACAIPGIMATRSIESRPVRQLTALLAPLMSCSARLPVYVLIIGVLIEPRYGSVVAGLALFGCHLFGALIALAASWIWQRMTRRSNHGGGSLILEIPPLRPPQVSNVIHRVLSRAGDFLRTAGTVILAVSVIVWAAATFPRSADVAATVRTHFNQPEGTTSESDAELDNNLLKIELQRAWFEDSYLARLGKAVQPAFAPAGFDWKLTVGVLASLPAREVIVATLGTIYGVADASEEHPGLRSAIAADRWEEGPLVGQPVLTMASGLSVIVFFALCLQCWATVAVLAREIGWRTAGVTFVSYSLFAWVAAVVTYQSITAWFPDL